MAKESKESIVQFVERITSDINKDLGGAFASTGEGIKKSHLLNYIPTGVPTLDVLLSGGIHQGAISLFVGRTSSGKTATALSTVSEILKKHPKKCALWVNSESITNVQYKRMERFGVELDRLIVADVTKGSDVADILYKYLNFPELGMAVVDSIGFLASEKELSSSAEKAKMGGSASIISELCRKIETIQKSRNANGYDLATVLLITQAKDNLSGYGSMVLTGGDMPQFASDLVLTFAGNSSQEVSAGKDGKIIHSSEHNVTIRKSRFTKKVKTATISFATTEEVAKPQWHSEGQFKYILTTGKEYKIIEKTESGYTFLPTGEVFADGSSIGTHFYTNEESFRLLTACIISIERLRNGLSSVPDDGYLFGLPFKTPKCVYEIVETLGVYEITEQARKKIYEGGLK